MTPLGFKGVPELTWGVVAAFLHASINVWMLTNGNITNSLRTDAPRTLKLYLAPLFCFCAFMLSAWAQTETYKHQIGVLFLVHVGSLIQSIYLVGMGGMTDSETCPFGAHNFIQMVPFAVNYVYPAFEPIANYAAFSVLSVIFVAHILLLVLQYVAKNPGRHLLTIGNHTVVHECRMI